MMNGPYKMNLEKIHFISEREKKSPLFLMKLKRKFTAIFILNLIIFQSYKLSG